MPLAVGLIIDALTPLRDGSFHRVLWISGAYLLLLALNPLFHTAFARMMSGMLRRMQFNLRSALVERLQQLALTFHEEKQSSALQTKILRDVDSIEYLSGLDQPACRAVGQADESIAARPVNARQAQHGVHVATRRNSASTLSRVGPARSPTSRPSRRKTARSA